MSRTKLFSIVLVLLLATVANAELARTGPVVAANGFPAWYQDTTGLTLDLCLPQNNAEMVWCVLPPIPSGSAPEVFPTNWAIENFYSDAVASGTIGGSKATLIVALEASFANGFTVVPGDQMVFARTRVFIPKLPATGDYTIYTPVGKFVLTGLVAGDPLRFTEDIGLSPLAFDQVLTGRIGPFLLPSVAPGGTEVPPIPDLKAGQDPFYDALIAVGGATAYPATGRRYIADPARIGPITGSPLAPYIVNDGTTRNPNIFRIEAPGGLVFETNNFTLNGRVFEGAIAGTTKVNRASYTRDATGSINVDVYASGSAATKGRLPGQPASVGTISTSMSYYPAPCASAVSATGTPIPPFSAPLGVPAVQMFAAGVDYYGQSQPATLPTDICVQANSTNALGQTVSTFFPAPLGDQVFITEALYNPASQSMSIKATSSDQFIAQTLTVDNFGVIDPVSGQLVVNTLLAPPEHVTVLSTGRGSHRTQMSSVNGATASAPPGTTLSPVATNDSVTTLEDTAATIAVLANDAFSGTPTVTIVSLPQLGTATVNLDGSIAYTPQLNANGTDTFTYHITSGTLVSNDATVTVTITPVNDPPTAINDTIGAFRGVQNSVNVLANDTDPDGAADLASARIVTGNATLGITAGTTFLGGVVTYTPSATAAAGPYTFTYVAIDRAGAVSNTATVTVNLSTTEAIIPAKTIYTQTKGRWTLSGTVSPAAGQTITARYLNGTYKVNGACTGNAAGTVIGTAVADALGNWLYDFILPSTTGVVNPSNTGGNATGFWCTPPSSMVYTSSLSPASASQAISLR